MAVRVPRVLALLRAARRSGLRFPRAPSSRRRRVLAFLALLGPG
jgi:hypothetical protein